MILLIAKNARPYADGWVGTVIQPGEYYTIQPQEKSYWQNDPKVIEDINSGWLKINDGYNDLLPPDGLQRLLADSESDKILFTDTKFISKSVKDALPEAASMCTGLVGLSYTLSAIYPNQLLVDGWLEITSQLKAITFKNDQSKSDFDIQIWSAKPYYGTSDSVQVYTWSVRNAKSGVNSQIFNVTLEAGSKIGFFVAQKGINPENLFIQLYLQVVSSEQILSLESY
jgi:hypothetical protein